MGCCGSGSTYGIEPEAIDGAIKGLREKFGSDILMLAVKDQNVPGKICMAGKVDEDLKNKMTELLKTPGYGDGVSCQSDEYDKMWNVVWRNTALTSGHSTFSFAKSYFPKTKIFVQIFDLIAEFGWTLCGCPNFGGVESRDDKGHVTSTVDWPIFVFTKDSQSQYDGKHLMLAVKDSNIPGKVCVSGPVGLVEAAMVEALKPLMKEVQSKKDEYDNDHDIVWRNTEITSGHQTMSFKKAYFPHGKNFVALLQCLYSYGWRALGAPNWGGQGDSWPSVILRKLTVPGTAPEILFASIKDSNIPGKLCFAGPSASQMADAVCGALAKVKDNDGVKSEMDSYDDDYDAVARDVHITTGHSTFSLSKPYFPRADSMVAFLGAMTAEGFTLVACPNFGGMLDSWPSFIFEKREGARPLAFMAIKDANIPGKVCIGGPGIAQDATLGQELLEVFKALCGEGVEQAKDDYDQNFDIAFRNTVVTTGHATFTFSKPYWPHGYVVELMLQIMLRHGYRVVGGPNFGDDGLQWPGIVFEKMDKATE